MLNREEARGRPEKLSAHHQGGLDAHHLTTPHTRRHLSIPSHRRPLFSDTALSLQHDLRGEFTALTSGWGSKTCVMPRSYKLSLIFLLKDKGHVQNEINVIECSPSCRAYCDRRKYAQATPPARSSSNLVASARGKASSRPTERCPTSWFGWCERGISSDSAQTGSISEARCSLEKDKPFFRLCASSST